MLISVISVTTILLAVSNIITTVRINMIQEDLIKSKAYIKVLTESNIEIRSRLDMLTRDFDRLSHFDDRK